MEAVLVRRGQGRLGSLIRGKLGHRRSYYEEDALEFKLEMQRVLLMLICVGMFFRALYIVADKLLRANFPHWSGRKHRVFVVRVVSFTHATVSGISTLIACCVYPELWRDPCLYTCTFARCIAMFSMGYFIHDTIDMIVYGETHRSKEYIIHHLLCFTGLSWILFTDRLLGVAIISLFAEVQTIFLHGRTMLRLLSYSTDDRLFLHVMRCNHAFLVLCRHLPTLYLLAYLTFKGERAPVALRIFLILGYSFLCYHNCHLQYRFLKTDGYLGGEGLHIISMDDVNDYLVDPLDSDSKDDTTRINGKIK